MTGLLQFWQENDAIGRTVVALLLAMSVSAWVLIFWKGWVLLRARRDIDRAVGAFWSAETLEAGRTRLAALDREQVLLPMLDAGTLVEPAGTLATRAALGSQLTRRLRDALQRSLTHLRFGQVLLASIGSTAPFIGLFGTVWGIYHALIGIGAAGQATLDQVAGPVGESLVMTAGGLAVAIPAVLGYNALVRGNKSILNGLNSFAHDLHAYFVTGARVNAGEPGKVLPMKKGS